MSSPRVQKLNFDGLEVTPNIETNASSQRQRQKRKRDTVMDKKVIKYSRGQPLNPNKVHDKKLRRKVVETEKLYRKASEQAVRTEILLPQESGYIQPEGIEKTWQFSQEKIADHLDLRSKAKIFDINLSTYAPYVHDYTRNGRYLLLGGRKGHLALMDWSQFKLMNEFHVKEAIRDVKFLHNQTMFAVAQKRYVYIYDNTGVELHCLRHHIEPNQLEFLPYHFLLVTVGKSGHLRYQDTSTGAKVAELATKLGECQVMRQNPYNAVICLGHNNGQVTMWSPNMTAPLVKMFAHRGPIQDLALDRGGQYMVTSGLDGEVKVWDIRTYKHLHSYFSIRPAHTMDISQTGLLSLGYGSHVQVWKDAFVSKQQSPYIVQQYPSKTVSRVQFCPLEDVLGVSHSVGFSSMVVAGAGEPNFDSFEANPFESIAHKRETTVHSLLEKLPAEMISLDPNVIASIDSRTKVEQKQDKVSEKKENEPENKSTEVKYKARGRSSSSKKVKRKRANIVDKKALERRQQQARLKEAREKAKDEPQDQSDKARSTLDRFKSKTS